MIIFSFVSVKHFRQFSKDEPSATRWHVRAVGMCLAIAWLFGASAGAGPWMDSGDSALRHDVQLLSDAGVHAPLTSWPLAWADVVRDLQAFDGGLNPSLDEVRIRVLKRYRHEARIHDVSPHLRIAAANHPRQFRTFEDTPRESGELEAGVDWTGSSFAYRLQMTAVDAPDDGKPIRFDGSYAAAIWGNWAISAGAQPRWWGPGLGRQFDPFQ